MFKKKLNQKEQVRLLEKIKRLTAAGVMQKDISNQLVTFGTAKEKIVGSDCLLSISRGYGFSNGLSEWITKNAFIALKAGENGGDFEQGLTNAISSLNMSDISTGVIIKALKVPLFYFLLLGVVSASLVKYAMPKLEEQLPKAKWETISVVAQLVGQFLWDNGLTILFTFLVLGILITYSLPNMTGRIRSVIDSIPIYRQYRFIETTNFLTAISHQTAINIPLKGALKQYKKGCSKYIADHINQMLRKISEGNTNAGDIFNTGLLIPEEQSTLRLLSGAGDLPETLKNSSKIHREKVAHEINTLKNIAIVTVATLCACIVGTVFFGIATLAFSVALIGY